MLSQRILAAVHGRQLAALAAALLCAALISVIASGALSSAHPDGAGAARLQPGVTTLTRAVHLGPPKSIYWGATIRNSQGQAPFSMAAERTFERHAGKAVSILDWGAPWYSARYCNGYCAFQTGAFDAVRAHGSIPFLTWAPFPGNGRFTDAQIAAGAQDTFLTQWAQAAKAWGHPFFLRFAWEMNGSWFPWGVGNRGTTAAQWVAMYRHVHDIFKRVGATNVSWVWCPNIGGPHTYSALASLYPGSAYVDWTCIDGYNSGAPYRSFSGVYAPTYDLVTGSIAPDKPVLLAEVGTTESGGSKPLWLQDMFRALPIAFPKVRAFMWEDTNDPGPDNRTDWPIESSPAAQAAFAGGIASPIYTTNKFRDLNTDPIPPPA